MTGLRVGVEVVAAADAVAATVATLPWMAPEPIALDDQRFLVVVSTAFSDAAEACAYAQRRIRKSASAMALRVDVVSTEAFPHVVDLRPPPSGRMRDGYFG